MVSHITSEDLIEFLRDTEPEWYREPADDLILRPLEIHEVPADMKSQECGAFMNRLHNCIP